MKRSSLLQIVPSAHKIFLTCALPLLSSRWRTEVSYGLNAVEIGVGKQHKPDSKELVVWTWSLLKWFGIAPDNSVWCSRCWTFVLLLLLLNDGKLFVECRHFVIYKFWHLLTPLEKFRKPCSMPCHICKHIIPAKSLLLLFNSQAKDNTLTSPGVRAT